MPNRKEPTTSEVPTGAALFHHQVAPAGGKTKGTVIQRHAQHGTNGKQCHHERGGFQPNQPAHQGETGQGRGHHEAVNLPAGL